MQLILVCTNELPFTTKGKEYPFNFCYAGEDETDGYIIQDDGSLHWLTLPSNCWRHQEDWWKSSDYFAEVVIDPEY